MRGAEGRAGGSVAFFPHLYPVAEPDYDLESLLHDYNDTRQLDTMFQVCAVFDNLLTLIYLCIRFIILYYIYDMTTDNIYMKMYDDS